jgi:hypothetical protein
VLADDSIPRLDGNDTKLIVNRVGGNLVTGAASLGTLFTVIYDDAENTFSTSFNELPPRSFARSEQSATRNRGWNALIPAGHTGWMKFWSTADIGILGGDQFQRRLVDSMGATTSQPHLSATNNYVVPVFPPAC